LASGSSGASETTAVVDGGGSRGPYIAADVGTASNSSKSLYKLKETHQ
jgi:hypothetical protein